MNTNAVGTIEEQGMLKMLEHLYALIEKRRRIKLSELQVKTGIETRFFTKLLNGGLIERTGASSRPFYQWISIKPNIYMAKETLKDYSDYSKIISDNEPIHIGYNNSVLNVQIMAKSNINSNKYLCVELLDVLRNPDKCDVSVLFLGAYFIPGKGLGSHSEPASTGLLGMRVFKSENRHISNWDSLKTELSKVKNIAYCSANDDLSEYLIIWKIESDVSEDKYKRLFEKIGDYLHDIELIVNYQVNGSGSIYQFCFLHHDKNPHYNHEATPVTLSDACNNDKIICFDEFWELYDKKVGDKQRLEVKWKKLSDSDRSAIMKYIPKYKEVRPDKTFRKNPETFLNNKSWNDELISQTYTKIMPSLPASTGSPLSHFSDQQLWDELKRRGYEGKIIKGLE